MLNFGNKAIFIAQHAIDFRKGTDGLLAECYAMELDPYDGDCVVFVHRSRRSIKVIGGNACGLWLLLRRFEGGALRQMFPFLEDPAFVSATHAELAMLLEGTTVEVKAKVTPWRKIAQGDKQEATVLRTRSHESKVEKKRAPRKSKAAERPPRGVRQSLGMGERSRVQS